MKREKAHVAAAGFATPSGCDWGTVWSSLCDAVPAARIEQIDVGDKGHAFSLARCSARDTGADRVQGASRTQFLAEMAVAQVSGDPTWLATPPDRRALIVGAGFTEVAFLERAQALFHDRPRRVSPSTIPMIMSSSVASALARTHEIGGIAHTVASACSSGADAIGLAAQHIARGLAEAVLVVGVDAPLSPAGVWFFYKSGTLTREVAEAHLSSRPFDRERSGMVLGEGAVAVLLTAARPEAGIGTVLGYASRHGGESIVAPDAETAAATIRAGLSDAGITAAEVVSINAHGTSTPVNEEVEVAALSRVFGTIPPVTANKGATGHLIGASGALEAVVAAHSASTGVVPPTAGTVAVDLEVDVVTGMARSTAPGPVLSNSFAFGGQNTALILGPSADSEFPAHSQRL